MGHVFIWIMVVLSILTSILFFIWAKKYEARETAILLEMFELRERFSRVIFHESVQRSMRLLNENKTS